MPKLSTRQAVSDLITSLRGAGRVVLTLHDMLPLAQESIEVSFSVSVGEVMDRMRAANASAVLAYDDESSQSSVQVLTLSSLEAEMATPFGQPLFLERPLGYLLQHHPLITPTLSEQTTLADACDAALSRPRSSRQDPIIARSDEGTLTVLPIQSLLLAQSESHRAALGEVEAAHRVRESLQGELVAASRKAGMAEIATGVLHNVGNVFNSVSVSLSVIQDDLAATRLGGLERAASLLNQQRQSLPEFFASERGPALIDYLLGLSGQLAAEQKKLRDELVSMASSVEHIKTIIAAQQRHAGRSAVKESVTAKGLCSDALAIERNALERHAVGVVQDHQDVPEFTTDRHLMLQALVNLISNAKQAIQEASPAERLITVRSYGKLTPSGRCAVIEVRDTGIGIAPSNLDRIFGLGFTTRSGGHGFGLHSAANAIQQLGGAIQASSEGPGKGATFTLTIPLAQAEVVQTGARAA
ncbi:MAG: hypothetical protein K2X32_06070 [Phycisphaerales bacterium]|nr:hypothetical protein [Phycisphaerales bacterium]